MTSTADRLVLRGQGTHVDVEVFEPALAGWQFHFEDVGAGLLATSDRAPS